MTLTLNPHFNLFRPEIDVFELTCCVKYTVYSVLSEIGIPCCLASMLNQHFNLFRPEIDVFELTHCVKCTVCLLLS